MVFLSHFVMAKLLDGGETGSKVCPWHCTCCCRPPKHTLLKSNRQFFHLNTASVRKRGLHRRFTCKWSPRRQPRCTAHSAIRIWFLCECRCAEWWCCEVRSTLSHLHDFYLSDPDDLNNSCGVQNLLVEKPN